MTVNNYYQQDSRVIYTFFPVKAFGSLLEISPINHIFLKAFSSEFQSIKICFTDQNSQPLEAEDKINLTLKMTWYRYIMRYSIEPRDGRCVKGYRFLSFAKSIGKNFNNKYSHKLSAKKSTTDSIKTASKRAIQKAAAAIGDLIGNKIADKITSISK